MLLLPCSLMPHPPVLWAQCYLPFISITASLSAVPEAETIDVLNPVGTREQAEVCCHQAIL